jgi:hypothetical protein
MSCSGFGCLKDNILHVRVERADSGNSRISSRTGLDGKPPDLGSGVVQVRLLCPRQYQTAGRNVG